jgi:hypothetical protein
MANPKRITRGRGAITGTGTISSSGNIIGGTMTGGTIMTGSGTGTTTSSGNTYSYTFVWSGNTGSVMSVITDPPDQGNWRGKVKGLIRVS